MSQTDQKTSIVKVADLSRHVCMKLITKYLFVDFIPLRWRCAWIELCHLFIVVRAQPSGDESSAARHG